MLPGCHYTQIAANGRNFKQKFRWILGFRVCWDTLPTAELKFSANIQLKFSDCTKNCYSFIFCSNF